MNIWFEWDGVMNSGKTHKANQRRFFAVASLGKERWYWVVWPSLEQLQSGKPIDHIASGYERSKPEAVDQALIEVGIDGEWVAAKYAKQYHRIVSQNSENQDQSAATRNAPSATNFLFRDIQDPDSETWYSVPHRLVNETKLYVYVEQRRYDARNLTGSWIDHGAPTSRLNRKNLERKGYAFAPISAEIDDPLFFATPIEERDTRPTGQSFACLDHLGLAYPVQRPR